MVASKVHSILSFRPQISKGESELVHFAFGGGGGAT